MKKFTWLGTALLVFLLTGCVPMASPEEVQGLKKEEAAQIAAAAVRQYYHVDVDTADREITLEDPTKQVDAATGKPIYKGVPVHAMLTRDPSAGDTMGFHAIIDPKTKQVLSVSIDALGADGKQSAGTMAEADLEKAAADFVRTQKLLTSTAFELVKTSSASSDDLKRYFYYTDGLQAIAVGVDIDLNQVVTFTYD